MSILLKNCNIINADKDFRADIYISKDKITNIGVNLSIQADQTIDTTGKYIIPGGVDVHTHLDMPLGNIFSSDDFETGTRAAAFGGTTTIVDFATQSRGMRIGDAFNLWMKKAEGKACIDYGFHMIITDLTDDKNMDEMVREGVTSFKLFMAYPNSLMVDDSTILKVMNHAAKIGSLICIHAEDGNVIENLIKQSIADGKKEPIYHALTRPPSTEAAAVKRVIEHSKKTNAPVYIVHVSSFDALKLIADARTEGYPVFAETCPQYLFLSIDDLSRPNFEGAKYIFTPPVREKWHQEKLWEGLINNSLQIVSTDHCPFNFHGQKDLGRNNFAKIPNGGAGIENRMQLIFEGGVNQKRISLNRWVDITSTAPAKMFGMYPKKGTITVGSDADIVIWDPSIEHTISARTHHMKVDYSLYEGFKVNGMAEVVISRGEIIIEKGKWLGKPGRGEYVKRKLK